MLTKTSLHPYQTLIGSITTIYDTDCLIRERKSAHFSCVKLLEAKQSVIKQYAKVYADLCDYFREYVPNKSYDFAAVEKSIGELIELHESLSTMRTETAKLNTSRNLHDVLNVVAKSKEIFKSCVANMGIDAIEGMHKKIKHHTPRIADTQKKFLQDEELLTEIKWRINASKDVVCKFRGLESDINELLDDYPRSGVDNLEYVVGVIKAANGMDKLWNTVSQEMEEIKSAYDRYNALSVQEEYAKMAEFVHTQMRYKDINSTNSMIDKLLDKIRKVQSEFTNEKEILVGILKSLEADRYKLWRSNYEYIHSTLSRIVEDNSRVDISIIGIKEQIERCKADREKTIRDTIESSRWLEDSEEYSNMHKNLLSNQLLNCDEYLNRIEEWRERRYKKTMRTIGQVVMWCGIILVGGWLIALIIEHWKIILGIIFIIIVLVVFLKS